MRSRVSDVKSNFKGENENFTCNLCENEDETQMHIIERPVINKERKEYEEPPKYEELNTKNVHNQVKIVRHFLREYVDKENIEKLKSYQLGYPDHVT